MDTVQFNREIEEYKRHVERVKSIKSCVDTSVPQSLGLKHLATRPKKQQLIDDRNHTIANENKKLMDRMTKIMTGKKSMASSHQRGSLNEVERRLEVDRINNENKHMTDRLNKISPILDHRRMEDDYKFHAKVSSQLRRRQMHIISASPELSKIKSPTFDSSTYMAQNVSSTMLDGMDMAAPIQSISDFRKHVIATKKTSSHL